MDRWLSFSRFGSSKQPKNHRCLTVWRQLTPARTRRAMPALVWKSIATQLAVLNHPHVAASYMRPSELLTLRKKDLVPPLVLLPCWSIVIAASVPGVSNKTGIPEG